MDWCRFEYGEVNFYGGGIDLMEFISIGCGEGEIDINRFIFIEDFVHHLINETFYCVVSI